MPRSRRSATETLRSSQTPSYIISATGAPTSPHVQEVLNQLTNVGNPQPMSTKKQEDTFVGGNIIKSKRTFGVEFEVCLGENKFVGLGKELGRDASLVHDGSIDVGIEVITPVLKGKEGETAVHKITQVLKNHGATIDESCSTHIHLGFDEVARRTFSHSFCVYGGVEFKSLKRAIDGRTRLFNVIPDHKLLGTNSSEVSVKQTLTNFDLWGSDNGDAYYQTFHNYGIVSINVFTKKEKESLRIVLREDTFATLMDNKKFGPLSLREEEEDGSIIFDGSSSEILSIFISEGHTNRVNGIKNVLAFYSAYDDVLTSFVEGHRRHNDYALRFSSRMPVQEILKAGKVGDIARLWSGSGESFNSSSKYCGINLNSIARHGTLEIRYMQGELDPKNVLFWVALNQQIMDVMLSENIRSSRLEYHPFMLATHVNILEIKTRAFFKRLKLQGTEIERHFLEKQRQYLNSDIKECENMLLNNII